MSDVFSGKEKRRFKRVPVDVELFYATSRPSEFSIKLGDEKKRTGMVDVSLGGIGFVTDMVIPEGVELAVTFHLMNNAGESAAVSVVAQVRHCRALQEFKEFPVYHIGAEFTKIDENDKKLISNFIDSFGRG